MKSRRETTILLLGLGDLGGVTLELLARTPGIQQIVVASRNMTNGVERVNMARLDACSVGLFPSIDFEPLNLDDIPQTAELIFKTKPDIILCTASRMTWWLPQLFPSKEFPRLRALRFGAWLPLHLSLPVKLMLAVQAANYQGKTLIAPFPDVVNCVLGKMGLTPTCGVGNIAEIATKVASLALQDLTISEINPHITSRASSKFIRAGYSSAIQSHVDVTLVAHHALEADVFGAKRLITPPFFLRVEYQGKDVTEELGAENLLYKPYPIPNDKAWHFFTASETIQLIQALMQTIPKKLHAPGPLGLPGGYPILASQNGVQIGDMKGLLLTEAIDINEKSHKFDGIDNIGEDGRVVFTQETNAILSEEIGYDCPILYSSEIHERAHEMGRKFYELAKSNGIRLPGN